MGGGYCPLIWGVAARMFLAVRAASEGPHRALQGPLTQRPAGQPKLSYQTIGLLGWRFGGRQSESVLPGGAGSDKFLSGSAGPGGQPGVANAGQAFNCGDKSEGKADGNVLRSKAGSVLRFDCRLGDGMDSWRGISGGDHGL